VTELASKIEAAYRARAGEFLRVATAIAGSPEGGRDAVQEALTRAFARRGTFRGSGTVEAWLWKAVVNSARNVRARSPLDLDYAAIAAALGIRRANAECLRRRAAAAAQAAGWADALWHAPLPRRLRSPRETAHALRVRQSRGQAQRVAGRLGRDEAVGSTLGTFALTPSRIPECLLDCSPVGAKHRETDAARPCLLGFGRNPKHLRPFGRVWNARAQLGEQSQDLRVSTCAARSLPRIEVWIRLPGCLHQGVRSMRSLVPRRHAKSIGGRV